MRRPLVTSHPPQTYIRQTNLFNLTPLTMCNLLCDFNTVYFVAPRNKTTPSNGTRVESDRSVIVVAATMNSLALFGQVKVGFQPKTSANMVGQIRFSSGQIRFVPSGVKHAVRAALRAFLRGGGHG